MGCLSFKGYWALLYGWVVFLNKGWMGGLRSKVLDFRVLKVTIECVVNRFQVPGDLRTKKKRSINF